MPTKKNFLDNGAMVYTLELTELLINKIKDKHNKLINKITLLYKHHKLINKITLFYKHYKVINKITLFYNHDKILMKSHYFKHIIILLIFLINSFYIPYIYLKYFIFILPCVFLN